MAYCDRCERYFNGISALRQHEQNSPNHHICDDCDIDFASWRGLKEHYVQSRVHDYCQRCDSHFSDTRELESHYESDHYYCIKCRRFFQNALGLHEHYRHNLNSHLNSSLHRPKDVLCPGKGCGLAFVSRSALVLHLESGKCTSGADRQTINRLVRQYDTTNIITNPARLLTGGAGVRILVCDTQITYRAGPASWNGSEYECYLCHNGYRSLSALNQHLASPRHQEKTYVCPLNTCHTPFTTLSGLCQHIESERCGVSRFKVVQTTMDDLMGKMRRLTAN
ncbi:hypothetical protein DFH07DRAFT_903318 [Mycena maculata]|uniref:C2H2-type domain-containing protein n=1 Tax=Mycena maculata TaxID=230809 RepID=A0AAD7NHQ7_9AGAR|nr:hypothetical protein DFH07DRAFT_903318 [Mycena maculata]